MQGQLGSASLEADTDADAGSAAQPAAAEGSDPEAARDKALRGLLASLALEVPADDLSAAPSLPPTSLPAPARLAGGGGALSRSNPNPNPNPNLNQARSRGVDSRGPTRWDGCP